MMRGKAPFLTDERRSPDLASSLQLRAKQLASGILDDMRLPLRRDEVESTETETGIVGGKPEPTSRSTGSIIHSSSHGGPGSNPSVRSLQVSLFVHSAVEEAR